MRCIALIALALAAQNVAAAEAGAPVPAATGAASEELKKYIASEIEPEAAHERALATSAPTSAPASNTTKAPISDSDVSYAAFPQTLAASSTAICAVAALISVQ
eukprot:TRINITY_DN1446_c0_g2_i1.p2 TRINITY_DN1446_c0_g2~~TRINITY_DN1446_c0_g2_i1.p2  ORF type:complete len:104 (-),score=19.57 TRINITY_DN1446_c0_g2_i1:241-552(-)